MRTKTIEDMIDNIGLGLYKFRSFKHDNFYCVTTKGKLLPQINTLKNVTCYSTIPSDDNNFQVYKLKSQIKTSLGYTPYRIDILDIPFTWRRFRLLIDISLPKAIYGHNLFEIYEQQWKEIVDAIYVMLLQFGIEISKEELENTTFVTRVDFCKNILIKTPVEDFLTLLQKLKKQRSKLYSKYETTISFGTRKKRLVIYDKIKEIISKASKNEDSITDKVARFLIALKENFDIHVIRIEQRLYGRQTIARDLKPFIASEDITFKSLFSQKIASYILNKHWLKLSNEGKFKTLLLGEKDTHTILTELAKLARLQKKKKVNPLFVTYTKLLSDIGEETTNRDIRGMKGTRTLDRYKKELNDLIMFLPMFGDRRFEDYKTITSSLVNWDKFSIPTLKE